MRRSLPLGLACAGLTLAVACDFSSGVSGVEERGAVPLAVAPVFAVVPSEEEVAALDLMRVTLRGADDGAVLQREEVVIDPAEDEWSIDLTVDLSKLGGQPAFYVEAELAALDDAGESVEWSGRSDSFTLQTVGPPQEFRLVLLYRGPLTNLGLTGVTFSQGSLRIVEGATSSLRWVSQGDTAGTVLYFGSSDEDVATVDRTGVVVTQGTGEATVFVFGGTVQDSATVEVAGVVPPSPADVDIIDPTLEYVTSDLFIATFHDPSGGEVVRSRFMELRSALDGGDGPAVVAAFEAAKSAWRAYGDGTPLRFVDEPQLGVLELTLQGVANALLTAFP